MYYSKVNAVVIAYIDILVKSEFKYIGIEGINKKGIYLEIL